jgi:glycosyltransferase involved in cell wall biosynthesis
MRFGLVIYGSLETVSGGYLYDRKLVEHLRRHGDAVEIISLPWRSYARHLSDNLSPGLAARLAEGRYDVLLQDELNHPSLFAVNARLRRRVPYPIISIIHHLRSSELRPDWQNRLYRWVESRYLRSVDGFIFNSQTTRRAVYATACSRLQGRPEVVACPAGDAFEAGLTDEDIAVRAHRPGPLEVIFVGNWIPRKGLHILLEALGRLPADACRLTVAGEMRADPVYTRKVNRQIERLGLADRLTLCGRLPDAELAQALSRAHVLAVPSSYEGFGIVYLEGMAFGLPAIATTAGAAAEIITPGEDGLLVPPEDAAALEAALARLAADRAELARMSLAARRRYQEHPTWEDTAANIRSFLDETVQRFDPERRA